MALLNWNAGREISHAFRTGGQDARGYKFCSKGGEAPVHDDVGDVGAQGFRHARGPVGSVKSNAPRRPAAGPPRVRPPRRSPFPGRMDDHVPVHGGYEATLLHFSFPGWRLSATALLLIACMIGVGWWARRSWLGVAVLASLSAVWLTVDRLWEIAVLFQITAGHGLALADLVGLAGIATAGWLALRLLRQRPQLRR